MKFIETFFITLLNLSSSEIISLNIIERTVQEAQIIANNRFLRFPSDENLEKSNEFEIKYGLDAPPSYEEVTKQNEQRNENISNTGKCSD